MGGIRLNWKLRKQMAFEGDVFGSQPKAPQKCWPAAAGMQQYSQFSHNQPINMPVVSKSHALQFQEKIMLKSLGKK